MAGKERIMNEHGKATVDEKAKLLEYLQKHDLL